LIDDAEQRGTIVKDATAGKLFPDMAELLLMQANRKSPTSEPHPAALDRVPQEARVDPWVMNGVTAQVIGRPQVGGHGGVGGPHKGRSPMDGGMEGAQRGTGGRAGENAGRGASQPSQGGRHGGQRDPHVGQGISHGMADNAEHMMHAPVGQTLAPPKEVAPSVQSDPRQARLTPAQFAIQQGKLQQQMERQQQLSQSQQQQQQQQLAQLGHSQQQNRAQMQAVPLHQLSSHQQQQPEVRLSTSQASAGAPQAQQAGMQGVQHAQWVSAYPDAVPRDPRQAPGNDGTGNASSSWQAHQGQQAGWLHSQYPAEARPGFGHEDVQLSAAHRGPIDPSGSHVIGSSQQPVTFPCAHHEAGAANAIGGNDAVLQSELAPPHMGGRPARPAAMPEMPAIPSRNAHHMSGRHDYMELDQQRRVHMTQTLQTPMYAGQDIDFVAVPWQKGARRDAALSHAVGSAKDPRGMHKTQSNGFAPAVAQLASSTHLGRNGLQHSAETPQVPQWTNNRR